MNNFNGSKPFSGVSYQPPGPPYGPGGYAPPPMGYPGQPIILPPVNNHLVFAIMVTIFCCLPGGVIALIYASQVNGKLAMGDYNGAMASSRSANFWCWLSVILMGLVYAAMGVFYGIMILVAILSESGGY